MQLSHQGITDTADLDPGGFLAAGRIPREYLGDKVDIFDRAGMNSLRNSAAGSLGLAQIFPATRGICSANPYPGPAALDWHLFPGGTE